MGIESWTLLECQASTIRETLHLRIARHSFIFRPTILDIANGPQVRTREFNPPFSFPTSPVRRGFNNLQHLDMAVVLALCHLSSAAVFIPKDTHDNVNQIQKTVFFNMQDESSLETQVIYVFNSTNPPDHYFWDRLRVQVQPVEISATNDQRYRSCAGNDRNAMVTCLVIAVLHTAINYALLRQHTEQIQRH